jgi:hypothetical protein
MTSSFIDYYRCPEEFAKFGAAQKLGQSAGFFRFGKNVACFGHASGPVAKGPHGDLHDALSLVELRAGAIALPFDADEILENFRKERYLTAEQNSSFLKSLTRKAYYSARPLLPVGVRKYFQRFHLRERRSIQFPVWPIDKTVDNLCAELMSISVRANHDQRIPFVWFWPNEFQGCVLMTHDVEHEEGRAFCSELMDLDERHGIRSSFQVVPEERYEVSDAFLENIRARGFELNVHDLNHDGHLFQSRALFQKRAKEINEYGVKWRTDGFRAGGMYRNTEWMDALQFSYDMSVPSAAHLEPQMGGCCTVMPYFLGGLVELPLTTTQDYSQFHILDQYSIDLWKQQLDYIAESNGLATFIVHPDYVIETRARFAYENLLQYLSEYCGRARIWQPLPRDAAKWWRDRSQMRIEPSGSSWKVVGTGSERARVAFAQIEEGRLTYQVVTSTCPEAFA